MSRKFELYPLRNSQNRRVITHSNPVQPCRWFCEARIYRWPPPSGLKRLFYAVEKPTLLRCTSECRAKLAVCVWLGSNHLTFYRQAFVSSFKAVHVLLENPAHALVSALGCSELTTGKRDGKHHHCGINWGAFFRPEPKASIHWSCCCKGQFRRKSSLSLACP